MTEVYQGPFNPLYGDRPPKKTVAPKDPYHEPYPGAWDDRAPIVKPKSVGKAKQPRGRERLSGPQAGCQW